MKKPSLIITQEVNPHKSGGFFCAKCGSQNLDFFKGIHQGKKEIQYHYGFQCLDCKKRQYVPRSKEVYELVKDKSWSLSKHARKLMVVKGTARGDLKSVQLRQLPL